jgi:type IV pilus assembly protein PilQ
MTNLYGRKILGVSLSLGLIWQPVGAAMDPMATTMEGAASATSPSDKDTTSPALGVADSMGTNQRPPTLIMGGVTVPKSPITMDFQDAEIRDVLHLLAVKSGLNIIYGADVTGPISVHLDHVPFDEAFQTVLTLKGLVALPMGPRVIRVVSSVGLSTEQSQAATFTRVFRLNYADAGDVKKPVDAIRGAANRKGVTTVDSKTNSLIVTDTQEGLKEVEDLIPVLDKKPAQVDIEAKIIEVKLDNTTGMGISWAFARSAGQNSYGSSTLTSITPGTSAGSTDPSKIPNPPGTAGGTGVSFFENAVNSSLDSFSFIHGEAAYLLSAQLTALTLQSRVKTLSTPHIVATNNEEAKISVLQQVSYPVQTTANFITTFSYQQESAGVILTVKPTVNADRRITLKIKPEVSNTKSATVAGAPPDILSRNADTTVVLRDGETIAIGGLITDSIEKDVEGVPFLMNIPILGYLFKSTQDIKSRDELIVFITPKIATE